MLIIPTRYLPLQHPLFLTVVEDATGKERRLQLEAVHIAY